MTQAPETIDCLVYRCGKQAEMYLYLRAGLNTESLPESLLRLTGKLTQVMTLSLSAARKLARADAAKVVDKLGADGYYLQMPPSGQLKAQLYFGD